MAVSEVRLARMDIFDCIEREWYIGLCFMLRITRLTQRVRKQSRGISFQQHVFDKSVKDGEVLRCHALHIPFGHVAWEGLLMGMDEFVRMTIEHQP